MEDDTLYLTFTMEPSSSDRMIDRWSVELAKFESKTKDIWEFKKTITVDMQLDAQDDTFKWMKSTIIALYEKEEKGKIIPMAKVGLRIYHESGQRSDERGRFDGWSDKFDEEMPVYSPKIVPLGTMSTKQTSLD